MWEGKLHVVKGIMSSQCFMPLDRGDESFSEVKEDGFKWHTFTCGDEDGASFDVEGEEAEIEVTCTSAPAASIQVGTGRRICTPTSQMDRVSFRFHVNELGLKPIVVDIGPVERRVTARRLAEGQVDKETEFIFVDYGFNTGVNAYWVRVVQSDGEMAWSSPIYVNRPQGTKSQFSSIEGIQ
jgi:hypothetical protein